MNTNQTAGVNGTGGGGGGCRSATVTAPGSAGGSGIVIVRYPYVAGSFSIALDSPANNQTVGSTASVSATASVIGGTAPHTVKFYLDSNLVSTTDNAPSTVTVNLGLLSPGTHTLYATATDITTATVTSATHAFTVDGTPPTLAPTDIVDSRGGGPIGLSNPSVNYTVTFSKDMNVGTVSAADFGNAGDASVTIGTLTETTPGVFTVPVTPTTAGSLRLQVIAGGVLTDVAGNALDTTAAIVDDTTIAVVADYAAWSGGAAFGNDSNSDAVPNGLAWLLGAANPAANATALLPKPANEASKLVLTFRCLKTALRGPSVLKVQFTNDLGLADPWTSHEALVPDTDGTVGSVYFDTTPDSDPAFIQVRAEIPAGAASPGGKLFGRLYSTGP